MMMRIAVLGERYFSARHLVWQVIRTLPDGVTLIVPPLQWSASKTIDGAAASRGFAVERMAEFVEQVDAVLLFADADECGGWLWEMVRRMRKRGLHIERYHSASDPRPPKLQMVMF